MPLSLWLKFKTDQFLRSTTFITQTNIRLDEDVFRLCLQKTSSKRFAKTSSRHLQDVLLKCFQDVPSRHLQDVFQRCLQDVFKMNHEVKLFLFTRFQDVFETFSKRWEVLQRRLSIEGYVSVTLLRNLWSGYRICKSDKSFSNFSFSLYFNGCLQRRI